MVAGDSAPPPKLPHIVMCAFPFSSHVTSHYALARALASAAPDAMFSFVSTAETLAPLHETANIRFVQYEYKLQDNGFSAGLVGQFEKFFAEMTSGVIGEAVKRAADEGGIPVTCVLSDAFLSAAVEPVAAEMHVPWVAYFAGFMLTLLVHVYTDDLRIHFGTEAMPGRANDPVDSLPALASLSAMRVRDLPDGSIYGDVNHIFSYHLRTMGRYFPSAAALVLITLSGLEQNSTPFPIPRPPIFLGPLNLLSPPAPSPDKELCLPFLDSHAPSSVAYVAFGSISILPPSELAALANGLDDSGIPFLWSLQDKDRAGLPDGFVERTRSRGKLVNWSPQLAVLDHPAVGVFVTHGGWNSVLESVSAGVAMLCRPILADQKMVSRAVKELWGMGDCFDEGITRESFVAAVERALKGDEGKKMRKKVAEVGERTRQAILPGGELGENFKVLVEILCRK